MNLYPITEQILDEHRSRFVRVEPHDVEDPESSDLLWFTHTPDDTLSEGEYLSISPLATDNLERWYVDRTDAFTVGGACTTWDTSGSLVDVLRAIREHLR